MVEVIYLVCAHNPLIFPNLLITKEERVRLSECSTDSIEADFRRPAVVCREAGRRLKPKKERKGYLLIEPD